jgi:hypothetical protein
MNLMPLIEEMFPTLRQSCVHNPARRRFGKSKGGRGGGGKGTFSVRVLRDLACRPWSPSMNRRHMARLEAAR